MGAGPPNLWNLDKLNWSEKLVCMSGPPSSDKPETIGAFAAKTELSKLLRQTRAGKHFIITQRGKPVAELRPIQVEI